MPRRPSPRVVSSESSPSLPDLSRLETWAGGDRSRLRQLGVALCKTLSDSSLALRHAIAQRDPIGVRRAAHDLKSALRLAGADSAFVLAEGLERIDTLAPDTPHVQTASQLADLSNEVLERVTALLPKDG